MKTIRCSSLPLLFACAPALEGDLRVDERNEAADLGSAAHEAMEVIVSGMRPDLDAIAKRWSCNRDELGRLAWYGTKSWEVLAPSFPNDEEHARFAESMMRVSVADGVDLTGHPDLHTVSSDGTVRVIDWKTGRVDRDYYHQLAGYAAIFLLGDKHITEVTVSVVWLRGQEIETYVITRAVIDQWIARLRVQLARTAYVTGRHCEHCARSHDCPAVIAKAREGVALLRDPPTDLTALSSVEIVGLYRAAKLVSKAAESAVASIRLHVIQHGPQDSGEGTALQVVEESGGRDIDVAKAWDIVQKRLPDADQMAAVLKIKATDLDDAVAKAAGRGNGASAKRELAAELEAAGAVTMKRIQKLVEKRISKEIP